MDVVDKRKKSIKKDFFVRYNGTGTIGKVSDIIPFSSLGEIDEDSKIAIANQDNFWIKIDETNLWYLSDTLEVLDEKDIKKSGFENNRDDEENTEIEETIESLADDLGDIDLESTDGIGGG
jgi:hypothetical protein